MVWWRRQSYPTWCDNILSLESKRRLSIRSNKQTLTNCTSVKPREGLNDKALLVHQCFDLFLPWSKKMLQLTFGREIRNKFSMAIFQNTKIFFTFMFITVKREIGMLITVIRYLSQLIVMNCKKAPLKGVMLVSSFLSNVS